MLLVLDLDVSQVHFLWQKNTRLSNLFNHQRALNAFKIYFCDVKNELLLLRHRELPRTRTLARAIQIRNRNRRDAIFALAITFLKYGQLSVRILARSM